jgi:hypothetical protein
MPTRRFAATACALASALVFTACASRLARDHTRSEEWSVTDPGWGKSPYWYTDVVDVGFRVVREFDGTSSDRNTWATPQDGVPQPDAEKAG